MISSEISSNEYFFYYFGVAIFCFAGLKFLGKILSNLYVFIFGGIDLKKYGDWAIVTGCTDGIGKAYSQKLAEKGLNLILLSRSLDKLNDLSKELEERYKIKTKVLAVDFTG
jgi:17beta-estradiol 17-dehydrogenase / very-long-chain 3-oxoacyl-CoA reductase